MAIFIMMCPAKGYEILGATSKVRSGVDGDQVMDITAVSVTGFGTTADITLRVDLPKIALGLVDLPALERVSSVV